MDRSGEGRSGSLYRGSNQRPAWRNSNRPEASSDDNRQFARKSFITSSGPDSSRPVAPGTNPDSHEILPSSSSFHSRNSLHRPDGSRVMKSFSMSSAPYQQTPSWNSRQSQPQRSIQQTLQHNFNNTSVPSTPLRGPGRKAGSAAPMWNPANEPRSLSLTRTTPIRQRQPIEITKSTNYPAPFWKHQDAEHEAQKKVERQMAKRGELADYVWPRKTPTQKPQRAYLNPSLHVIEEPTPHEAQENNGDAPMDVDGPTPPPPRQSRLKGLKFSRLRNDITPRRIDPTTHMAARKTKWPSEDTPATSGSDPESSSSDSDKSISDSVIELTDDEREKDGRGEAAKSDQENASDDEVIIIEPPQPRITIPLPQITPVASHIPTPHGPPDVLVTALDELCGATIRMQATKQLPFLLRNLRRGFRLRCIAIGIKTTKAKPRMPVVVRYECTGNIYETSVPKWFCPLCELHGDLPNKDMLRCHLQWDHASVILERWEQRANNQGKSEWRIHLMIPEIIYDTIQPRTHEFIPKIEFQEPSVESESPTAPQRLEELDQPVSVPPSTTAPSRSLSRFHSRDTTPTIDISAPEYNTQKLKQATSAYSERREISTLEGYEKSPALSSLSHSRPTSIDVTQESSALSTVRIEQTPGPPGGVYPSPPPVYDPLGPAAQAPFLPAISEYEGSDIYYSCRPGGPSVFDLLGTLPMEPFGVLEWDILEREEEIYESDEIKVEYKVMHALWLRWIVLNRNEFMRSYYKGTIAFIDAYWRMIHQAAGWRAMRYWLLLLLAQRFLTGREVAKALKHYEDLTGNFQFSY